MVTGFNNRGIGRFATATMAGLMLTLAQCANAAIQARVEPPAVDEMESVRLTLRVDGSNQTEGLDLSALDADFEVLGTNTSSQFQSINGRVQSWVEYQINLRPKRAGTLEIPSISIAGQKSPPLHVTVRPLAPEVRQAIDRMVFFEVEVSPNPVYVQAQALMTRRLYYSSGVQIYSDLPGVPDIPNAVVVPVGQTRSTTEARPEGRYGVLEQRYAIFPEQRGDLLIPEISVTSSVRLEDGGRTRRSGIRVNTPEIRLEVLPLPAAYPPNEPWLPAKQVSIRDVWEPDTSSFNLGEPVGRSLTVEVVGNTGSAVPPVDLRMPGSHFKQYPEPVQIDEDATDADVVGTRKQAYSIVPIAPGAAQVPDVRLTWWDTTAGRARIATAAGGGVRITGGAPSSPVPPAVTEADGVPLSAPSDEPESATSQTGAAYRFWLPALTLFAFAGWALTWLTMRRKKVGPSVQPARTAPESSWKALNTACLKDDAKRIRDAWIQHLGIQWETAPDRTVALIRQHDAARQLLDRLNRRLYSADPDVIVSGREVIEVTRAMLKPGPKRRTVGLPELHAH